jgi:hypothetical protein
MSKGFGFGTPGGRKPGFDLQSWAQKMKQAPPGSGGKIMGIVILGALGLTAAGLYNSLFTGMWLSFLFFLYFPFSFASSSSSPSYLLSFHYVLLPSPTQISLFFFKS